MAALTCLSTARGVTCSQLLINATTPPQPAFSFSGGDPTQGRWALSVSDGVAYTNGTVTTTGAVTVAPVTAQSLTTVAAAVSTATAVSGNNTAAWNPTLDVSMPAGALAGAYTGTVTTSLV